MSIKRHLSRIFCAVSAGFAAILLSCAEPNFTTLQLLLIACVAIALFLVFGYRTAFCSLVRKGGVLLWILAAAAALLYASGYFEVIEDHFSPNSQLVKTLFSVLGGADGGAWISRTIAIGAVLCAIPAMGACFTVAYGFLRDAVSSALRETARGERIFFAVFAVILLALLYTVYSMTDAFSAAVWEGGAVLNDAIYTTDSHALIAQDVYYKLAAGENDIRQPLFGLFALPFSVIPKGISVLCGGRTSIYVWLLAGEEVVILVFSLLLISRMLHLSGGVRYCFLAFLAVCYPVWLFALTQEQYVIAVFWLVAYCYAAQNGSRSPALLVAATGSLLTSAMAFPVLAEWDARGRFFHRGNVLRILKSGVLFLLLCVICGRFSVFLEKSGYDAVLGFSGTGVAWSEKFLQYCGFLLTCFLAPAAAPTMIFVEGIDFSYLSYQLVPPSAWNLFGLIVLALVIVGFVRNRKNSFLVFCFYWFLCSVLVLFLFGWGTAENGLVLYTLYYGWSIWCLAFEGINALCDRFYNGKPAVKYVAFGVLIVGILICNAVGLVDLIRFAVINYPR